MKFLFNSLLLLSFLILPQFTYATHALEFDIQEFREVNIPHSESLDISGTSFTVECWIFSQNPADGVAKIIASKQGAGNDGSWKMRVGADGLYQMRFTIGGQGLAFMGNGEVEANTWTHVASTYDGEQIKTYVNGELGSTNDQNGNITSCQHPLRFGRREADAANFYTGLVDEFRLWNVVRTEEELAENMNRMLSGDEEGLAGYWRLNEGEGQVVNDETQNENHGILGTEDGEDDRDPIWVESDAPIWGGILELSDENAEFGPVAQGQIPEFELELSNIAEEDDGFHFIDYTITDLGDEPNWLAIEPMDGRIDVGDSALVSLIVNTENMELGQFERDIVIETNSMNIQRIIIPVSIFVVEGFGQLSGRVTSAGDDQPVELATVIIVGTEFSDETDDDGNYSFPDLAAWNYDIIVSHPDYLTQSEVGVEVGQDEETTVDISLLYSELSPDPDRIEMTLAPDDTLEYILIVENTGNGPLTWVAEIVQPDQDIESWSIIDQIAAGDVVNDDRMRGVEFVDNNFYVSGGDFNDEGENRIYVLSREGEFIRSFPQFTESSWGIRDLTWDGQLLWGGDEDSVYGFTLEGELRDQFYAPCTPRCVAWDSDNSLFWVTDILAPIYAVNRQGEVQQRIDSPEGLRKFGLSWFPRDPDGFNLYITSSSNDMPLVYYKLNPTTEEVRLVADLSEIDGASEGGLSINTRFDPLNWVAISFMKDIESANVLFIEPRKEWIFAEPLEGVLNANGETEITLQFATTDFPIDTELQAELIFNHDGRGDNVVPINALVSDEGGLAQRVLSLRMGWNLISTNIVPGDENLADVLAPIVLNETLIIAKNADGEFYVPGEFDNIGAWNSSDGYWMKMKRSTFLRINGEMLPADTPIQLEDGWNQIAYMPRISVAAPAALSGLGESLVVVKDGLGKFYIPEWNFSNLTMREGLGYQLKVNGDQELVYSDNNGAASLVRYYNTADLSWLNELEPMETSFSLLVLTDGLAIGTRLEAYGLSGDLLGRGVIGSDGKCGISLWGVSKAENITIVTTDHKLQSLKWLVDEDGWGVASINVALPEKLQLSAAYPNPFNSSTMIGYELPKLSEVRLEIYDISGRSVATLVNRRMEAGYHRLLWDAADQPTGMYFTRLEADGVSAIQKLVLVK